MKRQNILHAAWELFAARGFARTNMRRLAAHAQVSTATIYAHFPDKPRLLQALIERRWAEALGAMLAKAAKVNDPLARLVVCITALNHAISADPLLRQLLVTPRQIGDADIEKRIEPIEDMMDARCAEAVRAAVTAGQLVCKDPEALAVLIRVTMQGWLLTESKRRKPMSEARVTGSLVALLRMATPVRGRKRVRT